MFNSKTVLILGAGASYDYGYPTGEELVKNIIANIGEDSVRKKYQDPITVIINEKKVIKQYEDPFPLREVPYLQELKQKLIDFNPINIDYFLTLQSHTIQDFGREMIAYEILKRETKPLKTDKDKRKDWYRYLLHAITSGCNKPEDIRQNLDNLFIITFNYDISLESYIESRLAKTEFFKNVCEDFCKKFFRDNIIHVYGQIRELYNEETQDIQSWSENYQNNEQYQYQANEPYEYSLYSYTQRLKNNIEVIGEDKSNNGVNDKAANWIKTSEDLFILGFGFDPNNLKKIGLDTIMKGRRGSEQVIRNLFYTNFNNHKKIERKIEVMRKMHLCWVSNIPIKSDKVIEDALSQDFDLIVD